MSFSKSVLFTRKHISHICHACLSRSPPPSLSRSTFESNLSDLKHVQCHIPHHPQRTDTHGPGRLSQKKNKNKDPRPQAAEAAVSLRSAGCMSTVGPATTEPEAGAAARSRLGSLDFGTAAQITSTPSQDFSLCDIHESLLPRKFLLPDFPSTEFPQISQG